MRITLAASDLFTQIAPWLGGRVVVAVVGGLIISAARRNLTNKSSDHSTSGFTLADLRLLKERGELDQAQYERAKAAFMNSPEMRGHIANVSGAALSAKGPGKTSAKVSADKTSQPPTAPPSP